MTRAFFRNLILWIAIAAILSFVFNRFGHHTVQSQSYTYTQFITSVQKGDVRSVTIQEHLISGITKTGSHFSAYLPLMDQNLLPLLLNKGINIEGIPPKQPSILMQILINWGPFLILIALWVVFMKQMQSGGGRGGPLSFGRSKARLLGQDQMKITFADVAGADEAKVEVQELVEFLKDPGKFQKLGGKIPCGVLLIGPPGTGKTLLAKAVAGEAKVPFFSISGSDFVEMFVGVGASRVRDLFDQAKKQAPCIIFIDEIDAVGRQRGPGMAGSHLEHEQTLNQFLAEMDGFEDRNDVVVVAATNRPDVLDPALLRPGRFDRQVVVSLPDVRGREAILAVHIKKIVTSSEINLLTLARGTPGFSGADLANLVNEAALFAARYNKAHVGMSEFEQAKDKIAMGPERRSMVMSEEEKLLTAYHESGHVIVSLLYVPGDHDPVHKVTIIPRGMALGATFFLPKEEQHSYNKRRLLSRLASLYGGRIAEEIIFGSDAVTTGAANDIEKATELARNMVTRWGFSKTLGPLSYHLDEKDAWLNKSMSHSERTRAEIDQEVLHIIQTVYDAAKNILEKNVELLRRMALFLVKYETMDDQQIQDIMNGREPTPPLGWVDDAQHTIQENERDAH